MTEAGNAPERLVLIAVDESQTALDAFNFYMNNLHQAGNKLLVVHGSELPAVPTYGVTFQAAMMVPPMWDEMMAALKERTIKLEEKFADLMRKHNVTGRIQAVLCSRPGELIVELAEKERCTMIVMGSRGLGMVRRTIMGSVSDYVLHHAHCPVVICTHQHQHRDKQQQKDKEQHPAEQPHS